MRGNLKTKICMILLVIGYLSGCTEKEVDVTMNIEVKTNRGDPVPDAAVSIDGKKIGQTDNQGKLNSIIKLPANSRKRMEIKKDSDQYYFAPFFESFVVTDAEKQSLPIAAVLYFVPKPQAGETTEVAGSEKASDTEKEAASTKKAEKGTPPAEVVGKSGKQSALDKAEVEKKPQPPVKSVAAEKEIKASKKKPPQKLVKKSKSDGSVLPEAPVSADVPIAEGEVSAENVALNQVAAEDRSSSDYPKKGKQKKGKVIFTIHVYSGKLPLASTEISWGEDDTGDLTTACVTNERGRCVVRFTKKFERPLTFVARKLGFQTISKKASVTHQGVLRFDLPKGKSLDIFAISKTYNFTRGLEGVEVFIKGKQVGTTDKFGHFSYIYDGKSTDLVSIGLKSGAYLPENFETDFIASGPMTLVKYFTPSKPPSVKLSLLNVEPAGKIQEKTFHKISADFDKNLYMATKQWLFSSRAFKDYPWPFLQKASSEYSKNINSLLKTGWQETPLKAHVDALLLPTIILQDKPILELSLIDSRGVIITAAKEQMDSMTDETTIAQAVKILALRIAGSFPFEGAVLGKKDKQIEINMGLISGMVLKKGDQLEVFGLQSETKGQKQLQRKIGLLTINEVKDRSSLCSVQQLEPRATIARGDLVVLKTSKSSLGSSLQVRVTGNSEGSVSNPISQANVYLNDIWLGATDEGGRLYVDKSKVENIKQGELRVIKFGFREYSEPLTVGQAAAKIVKVALRREMAFIRIESKPRGATVKIDGKEIGRTPLISPIPVPSGFVKLTLSGLGGYKEFNRVLELDQGTLDLTGPNSVVLEDDSLREAENLLKAGETTKALEKLDSIPKIHSDYLLAHHEIGEIYLKKLNDPAKAMAAFAIVTEDPSVKEFSDKRFIGSYINEAISMFYAAEAQANKNPDQAKEQYAKAVEILERVGPQLRFVAKDQYAQAVHNVDFYGALSYHKLWYLSKDPALLLKAYRGWRNYLEETAKNVPLDKNGKSYVENAKVYFGQTKAFLAAAKETSTPVSSTSGEENKESKSSSGE